MTWEVRTTQADFRGRLKVIVDYFDDAGEHVAMNTFTFGANTRREQMEKTIARWAKEWQRKQSELEQLYAKMPPGSTGRV